MLKFLFFIQVLAIGCADASTANNNINSPRLDSTSVQTKYAKGSWEYFLQHLPSVNEPILNYRGEPIADQSKHVAIIKYDVGKKDLQQCADVIMRLRAEYLFQEKRFHEIGYHFVSGDYYSWDMYNQGLRPSIKGNQVSFKMIGASSQTHSSLRNYLDIVYTYANTVSLARELKPATEFSVGTIIIKPGFPGHTCIIIDENQNEKGKKRYKLAEGFMPAQSIYVLSNPDDKTSPWYQLNKGPIRTSSYFFDEYLLKKFE